MAVEIFAGDGIKKAFRELGIKAKMTYRGANEPHYEVWELDKKDMKVLNEIPEWDETWGFYRFAKGSNMGTAAEFLTINGQFMIGWETLDGNDTYDTLLDYFYQGLGISMESSICALAVDLARANGKTLGTLFETYEG